MDPSCLPRQVVNSQANANGSCSRNVATTKRAYKMALEKFTTITSTCVPLPIENIDTDQIIPARFLKATAREGFGDNLFRDWRYDKNDQPITDFVH